MDRYLETFSTWNKVASQYQDQFMNLDLYNNTYDFICNSINKVKARVLDVGCGPGNITRYLISKRPDFRILGIDIAPNMIQLARKNNPTAVFEIMDIRLINKLEAKFDGIICGFCLPYLSESDSKKLISDSYNLLQDEGMIYLSFVEGDPHKSGFQIGSKGDRVYFFYHSTDQLKKQLSASKFEEFKIFKVEYKKSEKETETHTILTARKNRAAGHCM